VARFSVVGNLQSGAGSGVSVSGALFEEAYLGMIALGLSGIEARARLDAVTAQGTQFSDVASLIQAAFQRN
jgi:hypothetical protein